MIHVLGAATIAAALWVVGAFGGTVHPLGDSLAVFVVPVALLGVLGVGLNWQWRRGRVLAAVFVPVLVLRVVLGLAPAPFENATYTLYQKNMLAYAADRSMLIADIRASRADFVTLQEVSRPNREMLAVLQVDYPFQHMCAGRSGGGVAILSKHPLEPYPCGEDVFGLADAVASTPDGRVRVVAIHLRWPFPFNQAVHTDEIVAKLAPPAGMPTIVAGDFNMVPWGHSVRRIAAATDTHWQSHIERTFSIYGIPFFIDHVMVGPDAAVRIDVRPQFNSDHYGVLAQIAL